MIKNYLKIAFRNLWRHRAFALLNITGLTMGMIAFFLIFLYIQFELSYDAFHHKSDRIYRVVCDLKTPTEVLNTSQPAWAVPQHAAQYFPEIEAAVRVITGDNILVRKGDIKFQEDNVAWADSTFFRVFDFTLLRGNPQTVLNAPLSVVLTESAAKKYFGNADPVGQSLSLTGDNYHAIVTGLMKDIPENSQIKASMIISMNTITQKFNRGLDDQWGNYGPSGYLLLKPGVNAKSLQAKFPAFLEKFDGTEMHKMQMFPTIILERLRDVYLRSTRDGSKTPNITNVWIFSAVGVFILLIACINFINLTTVRSTERAKEVGIRKVMGAGKGQLARQFIGESIILCVIAFLLAVLFSALLLPLFNQLSGKIVSPHIFAHPWTLLVLFVVAVGIGVLAGFYPALVLSSFNPITILKGRFSSGSRGTLLRKSLVVVQFTISTALIISTIVVYNQLRYMRSQDLGFNKDEKVILDTHGDSTARFVYKQALSDIPGVLSTSMSGSVPGGGNPGAYSQIENVKGEMQIANLDLYFVDFDYIPQYKIKMIAGRAFSRDYGTDTTQAMVLNEAAVKMFGYTSPSQVIGRRFDQWGRKGTVIGVMKDFHFQSLKEVIKPLSMRIEPDGCQLISVNVDARHLPATLSAMERKWKELIPGRPWSYYFLDEFFDKQYRSQDRFGGLFLNFSILAIFISCLGLMGLASYSTMQRTKEIGIRKVIGASVSTIVLLLSMDFLWLVIISFFIAAPIAWICMHQWLLGFAYKTGIYWWIFAIAGVTALLIAILTVSFQAIRAATASPVKSLATE